MRVRVKRPSWEYKTGRETIGASCYCHSWVKMYDNKCFFSLLCCARTYFQFVDSKIFHMILLFSPAMKFELVNVRCKKRDNICSKNYAICGSKGSIDMYIVHEGVWRPLEPLERVLLMPRFLYIHVLHYQNYFMHGRITLVTILLSLLF